MWELKNNADVYDHFVQPWQKASIYHEENDNWICVVVYKNPSLADTDLSIMETSGVVQGVSQLIPIKYTFQHHPHSSILKEIHACTIYNSTWNKKHLIILISVLPHQMPSPVANIQQRCRIIFVLFPPLVIEI